MTRGVRATDRILAVAVLLALAALCGNISGGPLFAQEPGADPAPAAAADPALGAAAEPASAAATPSTTTPSTTAAPTPETPSNPWLAPDRLATLIAIPVVALIALVVWLRSRSQGAKKTAFRDRVKGAQSEVSFDNIGALADSPAEAMAKQAKKKASTKTVNPLDQKIKTEPQEKRVKKKPKEEAGEKKEPKEKPKEEAKEEPKQEAKEESGDDAEKES